MPNLWLPERLLALLQRKSVLKRERHKLLTLRSMPRNTQLLTKLLSTQRETPRKPEASLSRLSLRSLLSSESEVSTSCPPSKRRSCSSLSPGDIPPAPLYASLSTEEVLVRLTAQDLHLTTTQLLNKFLANLASPVLRTLSTRSGQLDLISKKPTTSSGQSSYHHPFVALKRRDTTSNLAVHGATEKNSLTSLSAA